MDYQLSRRAFVGTFAGALLTPVPSKLFPAPEPDQEIILECHGFEPIYFLTYKNRGPHTVVAKWMGKQMCCLEDTPGWDRGWREFAAELPGFRCHARVRWTPPNTFDVGLIQMANGPDWHLTFFPSYVT